MDWHISGSTHPISSGYKTLEIIPGITIRNNGKTLIHPHKIVAPVNFKHVEQNSRIDFCQKVFYLEHG